MADHVQMLREQGLSVPTPNPNPTISIQNEPKLQAAVPAGVPLMRLLPSPGASIDQSTERRVAVSVPVASPVKFPFKS
jgi:hypothetical protein